MQTGTLFIISAPSGAGKSSLINAYLNQANQPLARVSISHTTRAPRPGEHHGTHYYFVDHQQFLDLISQHAFVEYAQVFDHYYGTSKAAIETYLQQGINVLLDIDWQGARQVRTQMPNAKSIFILPPSLVELERRLVKRQQDSADVITKRMRKAKTEMAHYAEYDYIVVNSEFDTALQSLTAIINAERLRTAKQQLIHRALLDQLLS